MQQYLRQRWLNRHCDSLKKQTQASDYSAKIMTITKTIRLILQSLMLGLGGWLALDNTISPGMMIAGRFCWDALSPVEQVTGVWKSAKEQAGVSKDYCVAGGSSATTAEAGTAGSAG